jgi:predicted Holliday junction resolvase-like endonuclease
VKIEQIMIDQEQIIYVLTSDKLLHIVNISKTTSCQYKTNMNKFFFSKKRMCIIGLTGSDNIEVFCILERIAPVLEEFRFNKNDCRSLFDPIDYVIFDGLHKNGKVQKIFFIDIKSGGA